MRRLLALTLFMAACNGSGGATTGTEASTTTTGETAATADTAATASTGAPTTTAPTTTAPDTSTGDDTTGTGAEVPGCAGGSFLPVPKDTSLPGPWPVGARTVAIADLTVEVWYPAEPGSEAGQEKIRYDIRTGLPDAEQGKVSDADNPWQDCECWQGLPLDADHGPYPAVIFIHGTAGFRSQSLEHMVHWASRGFIVLAADHPGLWLKDLLGSLCGVPMVPQNLADDIGQMVAALAAPAGDLAFIAGHVDAARIAMSGHSAGGGAIAGAGDSARVLIPMAAGGVEAGAALESTLILGALSDQVVEYSGQQSGFASSPAPKRLVGIDGAGHLAFSSLCSLKNTQGQDFLQIAQANDVCGAQFASFLFDCSPDYTPDATSWEITQYASSAVLESVLRCTDAADNFAELQAKFPEVAEFQEAL
ncbi:Alpha/beta hydrolase family protein [Nannocystis exedens]|uniref:Alpha/beta hydrolase family protein n=1 Tax=Nannocystis exedens TaxID=54 RepID=A0A1I1YCJ6_9BACT|nr:hypothetical protein [Nannocystis exedens]PCC71953.1 Alpha/beta hydrolase family protein [Nannocystis exedens]SFE17042.1 Alpha/beta hydrolase family protein [Nannocystis exedens]